MKKKLLYGLMLPLLAVVLVSAAIYFATIPVTFSVSEALSPEEVSMNFDGFVGDCVERSFEVENKANNPLPIQLTWVETSNTNGVTYDIDGLEITELSSGSNNISIELCYAGNGSISSIHFKVSFLVKKWPQSRALRPFLVLVMPFS